MLSILHVSDLHFGPPYVPEVGRQMLSTAAALDPDVIVASGDFTQRATEDQYRQAREFLDALPPAPTIVTPGNHDVPLYRVWERLTDPYRHYTDYISEELNSVTHVDGACIVSLNSTAPRRAITNGRIDRRQLEFARQAFADADPDVARIVVAHHHFAPAPDYERTEVMPRAKRALDCFSNLDVELVLGGHLHRAYIANSLDIYAGVDRDYGIIIAQSGTTTSRRGRAREREKNSFNWVQMDNSTVTITHYMYFSHSNGFQPISRHVFPRPEHRHLA